MHHSNEFLLPHTLTQTQHEVMIGGLLGDSSLMLDGKYPRMKIDRQALDKPYIDWQFNVFKDLCKSGVREFSRFDKRYNKSHDYVSFRTRAVPAFLDYYHKWYSNGEKQVPIDLVLTPRILAVWFADDGCARGDNTTLGAKFSTESFGEYGASILRQKLKDRYGKEFHMYQKEEGKDQYVLRANTALANMLYQEIEPYIIEMGMTRKSDVWKGHDLTKAPKIGLPFSSEMKATISLMLELSDFSLNQLTFSTQMNRHHIRGFLNDKMKTGYFTRYESTDKFNLYHYVLTDLGKTELSKMIQ